MLSLFGCFAVMDTLKKMTDDEVRLFGDGLPIADTRVTVEDGYITVASGPFLILYYREGLAWEIAKGSPFTEKEVEYLNSLSFYKPDPNPNDHCYQRFDERPL